MRDRREVHDDVRVCEQRAPVEIRGEVRDENLLRTGQALRRGHAPYRRSHFVPAREQLSAKCSTDETRCTRNKNAHAQTLKAPLIGDAGF